MRVRLWKPQNTSDQERPAFEKLNDLKSLVAMTDEMMRGVIDAMDEDEQCELVALTWVGRGDFTAEEWDAAVAQARERRVGPTSTYLLGISLLASHLESGLDEFDESCEGYASDHQ